MGMHSNPAPAVSSKADFTYFSVSASTREAMHNIVQRCVLVFVPMVSLLTFIYGILWVTPFVVTGTSSLVHLVALLVPSWCLFGIFANLFLLHFRDTSIRGRLPAIVPSKGINVRDKEGGLYVLDSHGLIDDVDLNPGCDWFFCENCETYVPPRSWHCHLCKTCILRRDHHCFFSNSCVGEDNHIHFLGFLLYVVIATIYSVVVGLIYISQYLGISPYWHVLKCLCTWYIVLFECSALNLLSSIVILGGIASLILFCFYLRLAFRNETVSDSGRGVNFSITERQYSYTNLQAFLGTNPLLRLFWPFSNILKKEYGSALLHLKQL